MTKIKICGITKYEDAKNAVNLDADFLGFNFYPKSPRYIDCKYAKDIIQKLNRKSKIVGIFVNDSIKRVSEICNYCNLDLIQLSGDEDIQYTNELKKATNKKIIKAFRAKNGINFNLINSFNSDYIMLDSFKDGFYGGTGESFNLDVVKAIDNKKLFLAGGLNNKNVKFSIKKLHPYAIDVCSSIESKPGKKNYNKMRLFIEAVK